MLSLPKMVSRVQMRKASYGAGPEVWLQVFALSPLGTKTSVLQRA